MTIMVISVITDTIDATMAAIIVYNVIELPEINVLINKN